MATKYDYDIFYNSYYKFFFSMSVDHNLKGSIWPDTQTYSKDVLRDSEDRLTEVTIS